MSEPRVRFRLPGGQEVEVGPGALVGRLSTAAVFIDDSRVSEAHALVSLRGQALKLLVLRGMMEVDGRPVVDEVALTTGQSIQLAPGVSLTVEDVQLPVEVWAVELWRGRTRPEGPLPKTVLTGSVYSLVEKPSPVLRDGLVLGAGAHLWAEGGRWRLQARDRAPTPLVAGEIRLLDDCRLLALKVPLSQAAVASTVQRGRLHAPLSLVLQEEAAQIFRGSQRLASFGGKTARILFVLASAEGPLPLWDAVEAVWPQQRPPQTERELTVLRNRWDQARRQLRTYLKKRGIRDLVCTDHGGSVSLDLTEHDVVTLR